MAHFPGGGAFGNVPVLRRDTEAYWKLFEEAKKNVRALLLSSKTGASTVDIYKDYESFTNKPLPYM